MDVYKHLGWSFLTCTLEKRHIHSKYKETSVHKAFVKSKSRFTKVPVEKVASPTQGLGTHLESETPRFCSLLPKAVLTPRLSSLGHNGNFKIGLQCLFLKLFYFLYLIHFFCSRRYSANVQIVFGYLETSYFSICCENFALFRIDKVLCIPDNNMVQELASSVRLIRSPLGLSIGFLECSVFHAVSANLLHHLHSSSFPSLCNAGHEKTRKSVWMVGWKRALADQHDKHEG